MSYNPVNWVNGETPINDTNLNNMDNGIAEAHEILADHDKKIDDFVKGQIPEEYVKGAVDDYISENQAGLASKEVVEEVAEEVGKLSSEIAELENGFANIISFSGNVSNYNYDLLKTDFSSGTKLSFFLKGAMCNIVGRLKTGGQQILVSYAKDNGFYEVELTEDISSIGLFLLVDGTSTIYLMGEYLNYFHEANKDLEALANSKVVGSVILTETLTEKTNGYLYVYKNDIISKVVYDAGSCARCNVKGKEKAVISGKGWQSSYGYFLYALLDEADNVISVVTQDNASVSELEVEIPTEASVIIVNGGVSGKYVANIKIIDTSTSFEENYNYYSSQKDSKKAIFLGDSITALGTSDRGWVKYFIEKTGCELVANVAVNSAVLSDTSGTVLDGNPTQTSNNTLSNQVQKIINNAYEAPDIIMIAIGTNGGINITKEQIKTAYYDDTNTLIPLENVDRTTNAGAYRYATEKLHELYPNAIIFWCTPIMGYQSIRSAENAMTYAESLRIATEYSGQIVIDTIRCGINGVNEVSGANGEYLIDGLHPNVNGAKKIGYYNASKVKPFLE